MYGNTCTYFKYLFLIIYLGSTCAHMCVGASKGQEVTSGLLELELLAAIRHPTWVIGMELKSSGRASTALNAKPSLQPESLDFQFLVWPECTRGYNRAEPMHGCSNCPRKKVQGKFKNMKPKMSLHLAGNGSLWVASYARCGWNLPSRLVNIPADDHWPTEVVGLPLYTSNLGPRGMKQSVNRGAYIKLSSHITPH